MDENESPLAECYALAIDFLSKGAMPVIVDLEDGIHVLSVIPTDRESLSHMINPDPRERLTFIVKTMVAVHKACEPATP